MKSIYNIILCVLLLGCYSCAEDSLRSATEQPDTGIAGSYSRFLTIDDFLYVVDDNSIKTFSLSDPASPRQVDAKTIGERIESIFQFDGKLFIGSGAGLFIYEILADGIPEEISATPYFDTFNTFACDPVVANETHAYVTLNTRSLIETACGTRELEANLLKIFNIEDLRNPLLISEYNMNAPKGIGLDDNILFLCDDDQGLKIFNVDDPFDIQLLFQFDKFVAYDVIPLDGLLLVVGPDNVYQFDYSDIEDVKLISQIPIGV